MSSASDVFSLALVFWFIATGQHPYPDATLEELKSGSLYAGPQTRRPELERVAAESSSLARVVELAWAHDASARPSPAEVRQRLEALEPPPLMWPTASAFRLSSATRWHSAPAGSAS